MVGRISIVFLCIIVGFCLAQDMPEDSLVRLLESAKGYYNKGEYENAINELEKALQYLKQLEQSDQVEAYTYLAFSYVAFGDNLKARETFKKALTLNPNLELDPATVSPKIIKVFEEAKAEMQVEPTQPPVEPPVEPVKPPVSEPPRVSKLSTTWRSCCLPGWGQMHRGDNSKGKKLLIIGGITGGLSLVSYMIATKKHDDYLAADPTDQSAIDDAYKQYRLWSNVAVINIVTFLGVYFYNVYDAAFSNSGMAYSYLGDDNQGLHCQIQSSRMKLGYRLKF